MKHESIHYHVDRRNCPAMGECPGHAVTLTTMASVPLAELQALDACVASLRWAVDSYDKRGYIHVDELGAMRVALAGLETARRKP